RQARRHGCRWRVVGKGLGVSGCIAPRSGSVPQSGTNRWHCRRPNSRNIVAFREPMQRRPLGDVVGTGALTGLVAGLATGAIDAVWAWPTAAQFVARIGVHVRFVAFTALAYGLAGLATGFAVALIAAGLARGTRLGNLVGFGIRDHVQRRANDPRDTVVGLS